MTCTTRHMTLRGHFKKRERNKCTCQSTLILVLENVMRHFEFEVERQLKFVYGMEHHPTRVVGASSSIILSFDYNVWAAIVDFLQYCNTALLHFNQSVRTHNTTRSSGVQ